MLASQPLISLVIPVYNEESLIHKLYERVMAALNTITTDFEVICVNDGSRDATEALLVACHERDQRFKVVSLSRNFGHQAAVWAGLAHSRGQFIGIMDGDLQDPPELFGAFLQKLQEGNDVVYAVRQKRKESWVKRMAYAAFYRILASSSKVELPLDSGDFSMFTRQVLDQMLSFGERSPFVRGLRSWVGFRQVAFEYERDERDSGEVKYTFRKLLKLAFDGFFGFSDVPIRFMGRLGLLIMLGCIGYAVYILGKLILVGTVPQGFTTLILAIMFFGGVQLFSIRVIGEYVLRIFDESRKRPIYIVRKFHD